MKNKFTYFFFFVCILSLNSCAFSPYKYYGMEDLSESRQTLPYYSLVVWEPGVDFEIVDGDIWEKKSDLSEKRDLKNLAKIFTGMTKKQLFKLWGAPARIEYAGDPSLENECWIYNAGSSPGRVFFEAGRIDGWAL